MRAPERDWTRDETRAAVRDYFAVLQSELQGRVVANTDGWTSLSARPDRRNRESVERRHHHISAVLIEHGLPYVGRFKPLVNYPEDLPDSVAEYLRNHPDVLELMERDVFRPVESVPAIGDGDPESRVSAAPSADEIPRLRGSDGETELMAGVDFLAREQRNHSLGSAGEQFVIAFEGARLRANGLNAHADAIEHISIDEGDGAGFDIHSYGLDGGDRFIVVKTTRYRRETPFYVSAHEVAMSRVYGDRYWIYRVFNFREQPRLYMINGAHEQTLEITPTEYRAAPR